MLKNLSQAQSAAQESRQAGNQSPQKSFSLDPTTQNRNQCANANQR